MKFPKYLYRGDKYGNPTLPEMHYKDGLHSKLIQSGNPAYINKNGIYKSINSHIAPQKEDEVSFYKTSHFLSFSESIEIAKFYAADKKPHEMIETSKYRERRYLFTFNLEETKIEQNSEFVFTINFKCNRQLIEPLSFDTLELLGLRKSKCKYCELNDLFHTLLVLDVVSILKAHPDFKTDNNVLNNAKRDKEWLVLPYDYKSELYGYSSKIPRADFWSIQYFRLSTERERDIEESSFGMII